jgi:hypothetical protein
MKELHLETPVLLRPERMVGAVADGLVLIPVEGSGLWRFLLPLRWLTQKTLQDG